jgi:deaminated glutathione amidase
MQTLGDGEVVAVVIAGGDPTQMFQRSAFAGLFGADRLCATQREIANGLRTRRCGSELSQCSRQLGIERDLDALLSRWHAESVPQCWYTVPSSPRLAVPDGLPGDNPLQAGECRALTFVARSVLVLICSTMYIIQLSEDETQRSLSERYSLVSLTDQSIYPRAAAVQLNSGADVEANIAAADRLVRAAAAEGATLVVLPEKWTVIGSPEDLHAGAQTLAGSAIAWARETARELRLDLVAGSIAECVEGRAKLSNASVHVGPDGGIEAVYRKLHMFDVEIEGKRYCESDTDEPGEEVVSSKLADGAKLGMSICYDLRFPELFRVLALRGARVVALPAAFTLPTTRDHWEALIRARAIENQVFVVAANQVGEHPGGHHSGGCSMIVDPWGTVLARTGGDAPGYVLAELDFEHQDDIRKRVPLLSHRRPELYRRSSAESHRGTGA